MQIFFEFQQSSLKNNDYLCITKFFVNSDRAIIEDYQPKFDGLKQYSKEIAFKKLNEIKLERNKKLHYATRVLCNIENDMQCAKENGINFNEFRNEIEHLNVIKSMHLYFNEVKDVNSYYGLFCYILQRRLNMGNEELKVTIKEKGRYCKNLMWQLNLPFAYNLARYKNLSNEGLFYDNVKEKSFGTTNDICRKWL